MRYGLYTKGVYLLGFLLLILPSCHKEEQPIGISDDPFYSQIEATLPEMSNEYKGSLSIAANTEPFQIAMIPQLGQLVVADRTDNQIQLYDPEGQLLSEVGGRGRGPAEFENISQLHIGNDHALYVLDILMKRISRFEIRNSQLQYDTSFTPEPGGNISLRDIYVTEYGNFGVFHRTDDYETRRESFHLYRLDVNFHPVEHLLELPGDEKLKLADILYVSHYTGSTTLWDMCGEWFYYIRSKDTKVYQYNLETGKVRTEEYFTLEDRSNSRQRADFLKERMATLIERYPMAGEAIESSNTLPMFDYFFVRGGRMIFNIFNAGGTGGRIIIVNLESKEAAYVEAPFVSWRLGLVGNTLYAIHSTDEGPEIRILELLM